MSARLTGTKVRLAERGKAVLAHQEAEVDAARRTAWALYG